MSEEQPNTTNESPVPVNPPNPSLTEGNDKAKDEQVQPPDQHTETQQPPNQSQETPPILVKIEKEKWGIRDTMNAIIAGGTVLAVIVSAISLFYSRQAINLTQAANDSANVNSQRAFSLTKKSVDAAMDANKISKENYELAKAANEGNEVAAENSYKMAENAFGETKKSNSFNREAAMKELRAYQVITGRRFVNVKRDSLYSIEVDVTNVGKTPAYNFKCVVGFGNNASEFNLDLNKIDKSFDSATAAAISTTQTTTHYWTAKKRLNQIDMDNLASGAIKLFIVVAIEYYDIFKERHFTHGFYEYNYAKKKFNVCRRFNDSN